MEATNMFKVTKFKNKRTINHLNFNLNLKKQINTNEKTPQKTKIASSKCM